MSLGIVIQTEIINVYHHNACIDPGIAQEFLIITPVKRASELINVHVAALHKTRKLLQSTRAHQMFTGKRLYHLDNAGLSVDLRIFCDYLVNVIANKFQPRQLLLFVKSIDSRGIYPC